MGRSAGSGRVSLVFVLAPCSVGVASTLLAAWRVPSGYTDFAAVGALTAAAGSVVFAFLASRRIRSGEAGRASLEAEVASLDRKVKTQADQLRAAMTTDEVTGALNRSTFLQRLDEAIARDERLGKPLALLYVDIEGFREINRTHSRLGGDTVLRHVVRVLQGVSRGTDFIGRLGGDELGVILSECADPAPVVDRLIVALDAPPPGEKLDRIAVAIAAVTVEEPMRGMDYAEIFREAEAALQSVRGKGTSLCARRTLARKTARTSSR